MSSVTKTDKAPLSGPLQAQREEFRGVNEDLNSLGGGIVGILQSHQILTSQVRELTDTVKELQGRVTDLTGQLKEVEETCQEKESLNEALGSELSTTQEAYTRAQSEVRNALDEVSASKRAAEAKIRTEQLASSGTIRALQEEVKELREKTSAVQEEKETMKVLLQEASDSAYKAYEDGKRAAEGTLFGGRGEDATPLALLKKELGLADVPLQGENRRRQGDRSPLEVSQEIARVAQETLKAQKETIEALQQDLTALRKEGSDEIQKFRGIIQDLTKRVAGGSR
ncbi:MAG: hypothetical protein A3E26_04050 [Chlamydiae bacterium RIFCSPHIGHO2_12_FULL_49_32]|nr:MAG: hypothetical protein A3E26_04050 [Chlamydiae bacterium RIFCSPHIGHO2_12_FULL_49_32]